MKSSRCRFILSHTKDYEKHSKKWIIGYALLFWLVTRLIVVGVTIGCTSIYDAYGISVENLTKFGGSISQLSNNGRSLGFTLLSVMLIIPLLEEGLFRLGLSFKKWQVALALSLIPVAFIWHNYLHYPIWLSVVLFVIAIAIFILVQSTTTQRFWSQIKEKYMVSAVWITSIAFGLLHLMAFSNVSLMLLPYMFCVILAPFFAGCSCAYLRVNLGFGYGVAMHIFNNFPVIAILFM